MAEVDTLDRVRRAVAGLVSGDRAAWQSDWHRLGRMPSKRTVGLARLTQFGVAEHHTTMTLPHLHSTPMSAMSLTSTADDTDWFVASALSVLDRDLRLRDADDARIWRELAHARREDSATVRCRIGVSAAFENLQRGIEPPRSGRYNVHYFDDIAMIGGVAAGLRHAGDARAAQQSAERFSATHGDDGLWAAQATAALVATLDGSASIGAAVDAARGALPEGSWVARVVTEAADAAEAVEDPRARAEVLQRSLVDPVYSYTSIAPETLGLLLAHLTGADSAQDFLLGIALHPRHQDTLLALGGAVAALAYDAAWPLSVPQLPELDGVTIAALRGVSLERIAALLAE